MKNDQWEVERFARLGHQFTVYHAYDQNHGAPWTEEDGHGPVSGARPKDSKRPGEMILHEERGSTRFYDFAAAVKLARKDGWGAPHAKGCTYKYIKGKLRDCKCGIDKLNHLKGTPCATT